MITSPLNDPKLEEFLKQLHSQNQAQDAELNSFFSQYYRKKDNSPENISSEMKNFLSDKMVALDRDKALFCYLLCRSLRAKRIVEAGTSYGVSTLYLAAAVRDNQVEKGMVIGTEWEPGKAARARENFRKAGLDEYIDLREGDLKETLKNIDGPVDFMLIDIWGVALTALEIVSSKLRKGSAVVCDNTSDKEYYREYFQYVNNPDNNFRTMTLPFEGGLELSVRI